MHPSPRRHRLLTQFTYANVVATIALLVAVGTGSAFALTITGAQIKDNTVTTRDLKDLTVGSRDLATSAVTAAKLATNAVASTKIAPGAVTEAKIGTDAVTATKIRDGSITTAKLGANALYELQKVTTIQSPGPTSISVPTTFVVTCIDPVHVTGGGVKGLSPANITILDSYPSGADRWTIDVNVINPPQNVTPYAVCI